MINIDDIKAAAEGRWFEILDYYGVEVRKPMKLGPCPLCGGNDRSHFKRDGALYCRKCPDKSLHFPNEVLCAVNEWSFSEFCNEMGKHLGIGKSKVSMFRAACGLSARHVEDANNKYHEVKCNKRYIPFFFEKNLVTLQYVFKSGKTKWMNDAIPSWDASHGVGKGRIILCDHYDEYQAARNLSKGFRVEYSAGRLWETSINYRIRGIDCCIFVSPGELLSLNEAVTIGSDVATIVNGSIRFISCLDAKNKLISKKVVDKPFHVWEDDFNYSEAARKII